MVPTNLPSSSMNSLVQAFCNALRRVRRRPVLGLHRQGCPARRSNHGLRIQNTGGNRRGHGHAAVHNRRAEPLRVGGPCRGGRRPPAMGVGGCRPRLQRLVPNRDMAGPSNWVSAPTPPPPRHDAPPTPPALRQAVASTLSASRQAEATALPPTRQAEIPAPSPQRQAAAPTKPPHAPGAQRWMPYYCRFPSTTPGSSSSTPESRRPNPYFIPGLRPVAARSPTPAPPGYGGGGFTMAARRGAAPFFNAGTEADRSAAPAAPALVPARRNTTAAANRRPGLIRTWANVPHGDAARRLPNGVHHQELSSSAEESSPEKTSNAGQSSVGGKAAEAHGGGGWSKKGEISNPKSPATPFFPSVRWITRVGLRCCPLLSQLSLLHLRE
ncbi:hypothetical protein C2845_PM01G06330 [Panicum miliaceum]|uniref:Uncharacterized protein n=1 Tax=Panicum miliaceum TaxID=4540 RepID=A0A3L6TVE5_PANMI|nr:hypothetical protein C2845_PM01G06330 [Panicum miliaceum]